MSQDDLDTALIEEAATWMMRLSDENASDADREAWQRWASQSERHQKLQRLTESLGGKLHNIPPAVGRAALNAPRVTGRRAAFKALAALVIAAPIGWLALRLPWQEWEADYRTGTGAQRQVMLPEGTQLTLDTASAVNIAFDTKRRLVELISGRVFIATATDNIAVPRPFLVHTQQGLMRALGTRFEVQQNAKDSRVAVFEGAVEISPANAGAQPLVLQAGQQTHFTQAGVNPPSVLNDSDALWLSGRIQVDNVRLADLIQELARYRPGVLRCDPAVADVHVSGTYHVDDTDRALTLLAEAFPVRITWVSRYWVTVGPR